MHDDAPGQPSGRSQGAPSRYRRDERPRQRPDVDAVDDTDAVLCPLRPGEATFHHGWTLHSSRPNQSGDRRIGLNIQYLSPSVRQTLHDQQDHFRRAVAEITISNAGLPQQQGDQFSPQAAEGWIEVDRCGYSNGPAGAAVAAPTIALSSHQLLTRCILCPPDYPTIESRPWTHRYSSTVAWARS